MVPAKMMKLVHNLSTQIMPKIKYLCIQKSIVVGFVSGVCYIVGLK